MPSRTTVPENSLTWTMNVRCRQKAVAENALREDRSQQKSKSADGRKERKTFI
jgi:hypothetical protein